MSLGERRNNFYSECIYLYIHLRRRRRRKVTGHEGTGRVTCSDFVRRALASPKLCEADISTCIGGTPLRSPDPSLFPLFLLLHSSFSFSSLLRVPQASAPFILGKHAERANGFARANPTNKVLHGPRRPFPHRDFSSLFIRRPVLFQFQLPYTWVHTHDRNEYIDPPRFPVELGQVFRSLPKARRKCDKNCLIIPLLHSFTVRYIPGLFFVIQVKGTYRIRAAQVD